MTVTQASAVAELRRADPTMSSRRLYGAGIRIGRDHVASTVNTLVLAYAGASMPLIATLLAPPGWIIPVVTTASLVTLAALGAIGARAGGANEWRAAARVTF